MRSEICIALLASWSFAHVPILVPSRSYNSLRGVGDFDQTVDRFRNVIRPGDLAVHDDVSKKEYNEYNGNVLNNKPDRSFNNYMDYGRDSRPEGHFHHNHHNHDFPGPVEPGRFREEDYRRRENEKRLRDDGWRSREDERRFREDERRDRDDDRRYRSDDFRRDNSWGRVGF